MMELWKDIVGFEGLYQISNLGRVKSFPKRCNGGQERILKPGIMGCGYLHVCLCKNRQKTYKSVHCLVAEMFILNPDKLPEVNHKNSIKTDNHVENLEWCTSLGNKRHAVLAGLTAKGVKNARHVLTEQQVREIRVRYVPHKCSMSYLAREFNVSKGCIQKIIESRRWGWLK